MKRANVLSNNSQNKRNPVSGKISEKLMDLYNAEPNDKTFEMLPPSYQEYRPVAVVPYLGQGFVVQNDATYNNKIDTMLNHIAYYEPNLDKYKTRNEMVRNLNTKQNVNETIKILQQPKFKYRESLKNILKYDI